MRSDTPETTQRYVVATKRGRRGIAKTAADSARDVPGTIVRDHANDDLVLVEYAGTLDQLRSKIGADHYVEPEITYSLPETVHAPF